MQTAATRSTSKLEDKIQSVLRKNTEQINAYIKKNEFESVGVGARSSDYETSPTQ